MENWSWQNYIVIIFTVPANSNVAPLFCHSHIYWILITVTSAYIISCSALTHCGIVCHQPLSQSLNVHVWCPDCVHDQFPIVWLDFDCSECLSVCASNIFFRHLDIDNSLMDSGFVLPHCHSLLLIWIVYPTTDLWSIDKKITHFSMVILDYCSGECQPAFPGIRVSTLLLCFVASHSSSPLLQSLTRKLPERSSWASVWTFYVLWRSKDYDTGARFDHLVYSTPAEQQNDVNPEPVLQEDNKKWQCSLFHQDREKIQRFQNLA